MGKSWKEKPDKWKHNKHFQKKQQKKHGVFYKLPYKEKSYSPFEDSPEYHESFVDA